MIPRIQRTSGMRRRAWSAAAGSAVLAWTATAQGALIDVRLAALPAPSGSDVALTVPASQANFPLGSSIYLEIWLQTANPNGVSSASLDLTFDPSLATAIGITHSVLFSALTHSIINNPSGLIDDLSGSHLGPCTDAVAVAPSWARVAVVEFTADADGLLTLEALASGSAVFGTAICGVGDVNPADISFDLAKVGAGETMIPAASAWGLVALSLTILIAGSLALRAAGAP